MIEFLKYLLEKKSEDVSWFKVMLCRFNGHKHSVIWYNPTGMEPDMHCRNCGDDLG